jgi:DNA-binding NarL/FixJ family response regulator
MTTVLIVDDQALIRQAVTDLLDGQEDVQVVGEATNGAASVEAVRSLHPDVVLMDIRMPVMDGIAATAAICADPANAETRVLILTTFEEDDYVVQALRAGASGFIGKGSEPEEILRAMRCSRPPRRAASSPARSTRRPCRSPPKSSRSPSASGRFWSSSRADARTRRSPTSCSSRRTPRRRTSTASWRRWARTIARSS